MNKSKFRWLAVATAFALLSPISSLPAAAPAVAQDDVDVVAQVQADLVQQLIGAARDDTARQDLFAALLKQGVVDPTTVLAGSRSGEGQEFTRWAAEADRAVKESMGLPRMEASSLQIYVADPVEGLPRGQLPLFAVAPSHEEEKGEEPATTFTAFDLGGQPVELSLWEAPRFPVIFAGLDMDAITDAGVSVISEALNASGVLSDVLPVGPPAVPEPTTRLDTIRVKNVQETGNGSWWCWLASYVTDLDLCDAEVVAFTMGGSNGQARVDVISLTTVNKSNKTYTVNRNIINWNAYSWNNVDFLVMEIDATTCGASFSTYGKVIADAIKIPGSAPYWTPLTSTARSALGDKSKFCSSWVSYFNPPDYLDSFMGLTVYSVGTQIGVGNNVTTTMSLV